MRQVQGDFRRTEARVANVPDFAIQMKLRTLYGNFVTLNAVQSGVYY